MEIWIGGEVESDIFDSFRKTRKLVMEAISEAFKDRTYDISLNCLSCIAIIRNDSRFGEIAKYCKKTCEMDFRLRIDHGLFLAGNTETRCKLFCSMLARSLDMLKDSGVNGPEMDRLCRDFQNAVQKNGWD